MAKVQIQLGLDVDIYALIENKRGAVPRARFINKMLRGAMADDLPQQTAIAANTPSGVPA